ncbi:Protein YhfA [Porphyromonas levii]|uniref:OsmC family peroxiredoxin n=1 Tax=Porphyromonas levii TaxID=28114 RepID=A0A4Y8WQ72_9PORP|nr:OsmC family protein [Porphyromonas levii]MBR8730208.1 Protein YhfA [Porphyromonas levii]MBR8732118.1 Protein YhfA [Porphyromonas levii]MBR8764414.1 Protein YhfA [Porphyromonas levii]MBR8765846.1 Protein YhfA [Porphyromonas levii]MBR8770452.1 Protein YhfA [Porphyromonas levii]
MKCTYKLIDGYLSEVDNGRGHSVLMDLPTEAGGTDKAPKAFEYLAMALNGCIGTIFVDVARKMRIDVQELKIELNAEVGDTIDSIDYKFYIKTNATPAKVEKCLDTTERYCPVGLLFHKANVPFTHEIVML